MSDPDPIWNKLDSHSTQLTDQKLELRMFENRLERLEKSVADNQQALLHELNAFRSDIAPLCKRIEEIQRENYVEQGRREEREKEEVRKDQGIKKFQAITGIVVGGLTILTIFGLVGVS